MNTLRTFLLCLAVLLSNLFAIAESPAQNQAPASAKFLAELSALGTDNAGDAAISGDTIIVSGGYDNFIDVYEKPANGWQTTTTPNAILRCDNAFECTSVAIYGDTVAAITSNNGNYGFAVDVFVKPPGGWKNMTQTAVLTDPDPAAAFVAICLNGSNLAAVSQEGGNPGYNAHIDIFGKSSGDWRHGTPSAVLKASNGDYFDALAMSGRTIIAGAPEYYGNLGLGAAYIFIEPAGGWVDATENAKLSPTDGSPYGALFGISVAISSDATEVIVGEQFSSNGAGAAFEFTMPPNGWQSTTQTAEFTRTTGGTFDDEFGSEVAINGNVALVGAENAGAPYGQGLVYLYEEPEGGWTDATPTTHGTCPNEACGKFGASVAIAGSIAVIGSTNHNGAAWVYGR